MSLSQRDSEVSYANKKTCGSADFKHFSLIMSLISDCIFTSQICSKYNNKQLQRAKSFYGGDRSRCDK